MQVFLNFILLVRRA